MIGSNDMLSFGLPAFGIAFAVLGLVVTWFSSRRYDAHFGKPENSHSNSAMQPLSGQKFGRRIGTLLVSMNAHSEGGQIPVPVGHSTSSIVLSYPNSAPEDYSSISQNRLNFSHVKVDWSAKRALDLVIASAMFFLLFPLLAVIALIVYAGDRGPPLFRHMRLGRHGRPFGCLKFRSMVPNGEAVLARHLAENPAARAEWAATHKLTDDPRVTPVGNILRKTSLDELPQLWNVIRGDMSLVGPKPIVRADLDRYGSAFTTSFAVKPGVTGLWQVSGRSDTSYSERVRLDVDYATHWSLWRDIAIMLRTIPAILSQRGAR